MKAVFENFKYRGKHPKSRCSEVKYRFDGIARCKLEKGHLGPHVWFP